MEVLLRYQFSDVSQFVNTNASQRLVAQYQEFRIPPSEWDRFNIANSGDLDRDKWQVRQTDSVFV